MSNWYSHAENPEFPPLSDRPQKEWVSTCCGLTGLKITELCSAYIMNDWGTLIEQSPFI